MDPRFRWPDWLGIAAVAIFVGATAAGSMLDPEYSQLRHHVSELTATGAPTWAALAPFYIAYNILMLASVIRLYLGSSRGRLWTIGPVLMTINAVAGIGMATMFRQDIGGAPTTFAGSAHLVLAGISSLTIVVGAAVFGLAFRRSESWRPLAAFSFAVAVGFVILGPLAVFATAEGSELAGLAERGPIGLFLVWLVGVGWFGLTHGREPDTSARRATGRGAHPVGS